MAEAKVIDADGHIIERTDELRKYLKSPFNKRGVRLQHPNPGIGTCKKLCRHTRKYFRARRGRRTGSVSWMTTASSWRFSIRHPWATCRGSASLIMPWLFARLTTTTFTITT